MEMQYKPQYQVYETSKKLNFSIFFPLIRLTMSHIMSYLQEPVGTQQYSKNIVRILK